MKRHLALPLGFLQVLSGTACLGAGRYEFERLVLDNGLTVISLEDHSCPIVAVQVWYAVGSKDEDPARQGFAHMFEHMMFRGTERLGPEAHFEHIRRTGGECNAFTSFDNTTYVNQLPANQLDLALWLEAERMAALRIDSEGFHKERAVVEEERRLRSLDAPYGTVPEKLLAELFKAHPYRWTPIGQIPHLRAATIEELQAFWDRYYVPSNATLVVVGDVSHSEVQRLAKKNFGWIPRSPNPPRITVREPLPTEPRTITIPEKKGPAPLVGLVYRGVPQGHPDQVPLDLLMSILGGGESSRMYRDLVKERKLAQVAMAGAFSLQDDGIVGAGAALMPWGDKEGAIEALRTHLRRAREEPVAARELEKAKNQMLSTLIKESLTVESKAGLLGKAQTIEGDADKANSNIELVRAVKVEDLQRVARTYLDADRESVVKVQPGFGGMLKSLFGGKNDAGDEGAAPVPKPAENRVAVRGGPRAELKRPEELSFTPPNAPLFESISEVPHRISALENGMRIVVIPDHEVPFITITLGLRYGAWTETKPSTASLASQMITKGSQHHTAAELAEELEYNAISLNGSVGLDMGTVTASCTSDKFEKALGLLAEVARTPTFPKDELDILRQQILLVLMIQSRTPEYAADREFRKQIFGRHPYSRTPAGEPADVRAVTAEDLRQWWRSFVAPETCVLYVAGDISAETAASLIRSAFADWKPGEAKPAIRSMTPPAPSSTRIFLVDRPGSVQSQIRVGHLGITRDHPQYFNGLVLSQIFGGAFNSRLNKAIRIEKGLTYGARGGLRADRFAGLFSVSTSTKTPATVETLKIILEEIARLQAAPTEKAEADDARSYLVGSFAGNRETPAATINDLWLVEYAMLPADYFKMYLQAVRNAEPENMHRAARELIDRNRLTIVVVGEAEKLQAELEAIAPVTLVAQESLEGAPETKDKPGS